MMIQHNICYPTISLDQVKGVLIDIDDTLYQYEAPHEAALIACYHEFSQSFPHSFDEFCALYRQCRTGVVERLFPQGACRSRLLAFLALFESLNFEPAYEMALDYDGIYWDTFLDHMTVEPDAVAFLEGCHERQIAVVAVTNMEARIQIEKLGRLGLATLIQLIVTSEEVGAEKPSPLMFETAIKKLGLTAADVIMVGDDPVKDIEAAEQVGIKAYQVQLPQ